MINDKKIIFKANNDQIFNIEEIPEPANKNLPRWYAKTPMFSDGEQSKIKSIKNYLRTGNKWHQTFKGCTPFIDVMTSGYIIKTQTSFAVIKTIGEDSPPRFDWESSYSPIDTQAKEVLGKYPIPFGYNPNSFRWIVNWKIITPPGYSLLITHPHHRYDLPFITMSGIVDTDKHPNSLFLPFFIKDDFEGMIEQDTPIAQIIPIKRDSWISKKQNFESKDQYKEEMIRRAFSNGYKKFFWSKKEYK